MNDNISALTKKTAELCRLSLSEKELSDFSRDMESIYRFAAKLEGVDVSNAKASSVANVLRPDTLEKFADTEALAKTAPEDSLVDGCFTVPKAVD